MLAGGRSVRFGGEKAVALLEGRPLLAWAEQRLRTACANVAINVRPGTESEAAAKALRAADALRCGRRCRGPARRREGRVDLGRRAGCTHACREPVRRAALARRSLRSPARARRGWGGDGRNRATVANRSAPFGRSRRCRWSARHWPVELIRRRGKCSNGSARARCCSSLRRRSRTSIRATTWLPSRLCDRGPRNVAGRDRSRCLLRRRACDRKLVHAHTAPDLLHRAGARTTLRARCGGL